MLIFFWLFLIFYIFHIQLIKFSFYGYLSFIISGFYFNFTHQGLQSNFFFKFFVYLLTLFWFFGIFFPLYSPWSRVGFLFFITTFSWLSVRLFTLMRESFFVMFELEHSWNWLISIIIFFSHLLSYFISGVALCLRISIIFLIGHFLIFLILGIRVFSSFIFIFLVLPVELFFAFLQSYIFLTLICIFLLNMICYFSLF